MEHSQRAVKWGNWGITFLLVVQPDHEVSVGFLSFPVGTCGPIDGTFGSPERQRYQDLCTRWVSKGILPAEGRDRHFGWIFKLEGAEDH
jgi:hypothetical protein